MEPSSVVLMLGSDEGSRSSRDVFSFGSIIGLLMQCTVNILQLVLISH